MIIVLFILIIALIAGIVMAILSEKKNFNNGICPHCNKELRRFDTDSQGGRGYCCDDCDYYVWVSYNCVDSINKKMKT